ncbi:MAG: tetratricopeptide repeat protein, partial [candidate division Zixibacteria bacterium]|nr:tetratricopeptide repeat protein [candidate division Zixibacteria bacterium]
MDEALQEYKRALRIDPSNRKALLSLGGAYEAKREFSQAIRVYQEALAQDTSDIILRSKLIQLYFNSGEKKKALEEGIKLY